MWHKNVSIWHNNVSMWHKTSIRSFLNDKVFIWYKSMECLCARVPIWHSVFVPEYLYDTVSLCQRTYMTQCQYDTKTSLYDTPFIAMLKAHRHCVLLRLCLIEPVSYRDCVISRLCHYDLFPHIQCKWLNIKIRLKPTCIYPKFCLFGHVRGNIKPLFLLFGLMNF